MWTYFSFQVYQETIPNQVAHPKNPIQFLRLSSVQEVDLSTSWKLTLQNNSIIEITSRTDSENVFGKIKILRMRKRRKTDQQRVSLFQ